MGIRFGIPSLDSMTDLSVREFDVSASPASTSAAILGPDGSGKSIIALHAASTYLLDSWTRFRGSLGKKDRLPVVLYISSDLKYSSALKVWNAFNLESPCLRAIPFEKVLLTLDRTRQSLSNKDLKISLVPVTPAGNSVYDAGVMQMTVPEFLASAEECRSPAELKVGFLDLAKYTAGDDWSYVNKLLGQLAEGAGSDRSRNPHLIVIDSVAGFETYVGTYDAFGYVQTRRSRIAQCTRTAGESCSLLFVVEEAITEAHLPEEYVTDTVIRLRIRHAGPLFYRTLEIEKARARDHATGEQTFEIRGPKGTSTGNWENADEPQVANAYVHVFSSLPLKNNLILRSLGAGKMVPVESIAPFGVKHLDGLLAKGDRPGLEGAVRREKGASLQTYSAQKDGGLPTSSVTALIGDSSTGKSQLAEAFLANNFLPIIELFLQCYFALKEKNFGSECLRDVLYLIAKNSISEDPSIGKDNVRAPISYSDFYKKVKAALREGEKQTRIFLNKSDDFHGKSRDLDMRRRALKQKVSSRSASGADLEEPLKSRMVFLQQWEEQLDREIASRVIGEAFDGDFCQKFLKFVFEHPNLMWPSVLITTSYQNSGLLASRSFVYLTEHIEKAIAKHLLTVSTEVLESEEQNELIQTLFSLIEMQFIVRRTDLRDSDSSVLLHLIQQNIVQAQELIFGPAFPERASLRFHKSRRIRLVIDDLRVLLNVRPTAAQDSTLLPFLPFYLDREGITALFVYTEAVRPNERPHDALCANLMSLSRHSLVLWNVPFAGQKRVALTVLPAIRPDLNGVVRELTSDEDRRIEQRIPKAGQIKIQAYRRPKATRYFELFSGIEEGRPVRVPLKIYIYRETVAFESVFERAEKLFQGVFGHNLSGSHSHETRIFQCLNQADYQILREMTHLPMRTLEDESIVFQVDGYWSLRPQEVLHDQSEYLTQSLGYNDQHVEEWENDYFSLYGINQCPDLENPQANRRIDFFRNEFYASRLIGFRYDKQRLVNGVPDRVPLMWDFGFMLGHAEAWKLAEERDIPGIPGMKVGGVLASLTASPEAVSWRQFAGACQEVQREWQRHRGEVLKIFDLAMPSSESLNCLFLEVYFSELAQVVNEELLKRLENDLCPDVYLKDGCSPIKLEEVIWDNQSPMARKNLIKRWRACFEHDSNEGVSFDSIPKGFLALYKTWLLFLELFPSSPAFTLKERESFAPRLEAEAVAIRHWYKTACESQARGAHPTKRALTSDPMLMRLAGRYSCRGDWFLAASRASRSKLLTERAMDLLCSRRANIERLQYGLGLPVRDILPNGQCSRFLTALRTSHPKVVDLSQPGKDALMPPPTTGLLTYGELAEKAPKMLNSGDKVNFHPLWRTSFQNYDRQSLVLEKWLGQLFSFTKSYRASRGNRWDVPFKGYDELCAGETAAISTYQSFVYLAEQADDLSAWLSAAGRVDATADSHLE